MSCHAILQKYQKKFKLMTIFSILHSLRESELETNEKL